MRHILSLAGAVLIALQADAALAATARATSYQVSDLMTAPGFATASATNVYGYVNANAYEYRGGVGVFAFSSATSTQSRTFNVATAEAFFSESITVGRGANPEYNLSAIGDGTVFELTWAVQPSGNLSTSTSVYSATSTSFAGSRYSYDWSFGGNSGSGLRYQDKSFNEPLKTSDTHSELGGVSYVRFGDVLNLSLHAVARASTFALPNAPASASAEFDHTLRWGGITAIRAFDAQGVEIELPAGFAIALGSSDGQFDYFNAAGPNPFVTPVPEPGEWAMLTAGLAVIAAVARRRRRQG